jgi:hypothetical protein
VGRGRLSVARVDLLNGGEEGVFEGVREERRVVELERSFKDQGVTRRGGGNEGGRRRELQVTTKPWSQSSVCPQV